MGCIYCQGDEAIFDVELDNIFVDRKGNLDVFCGKGGGTTHLHAEINYCPMCGRFLSQPEPLTIEQLREMENTPVWIKEEINGRWTSGLWVICNGFEWRHGHVADWITFGNYESMACDDYGKTWLAYATKPDGEG